jgi:plasmid stabilization system protein ParE
MNYRVEVTQSAERDAHEAYAWIAADSPANALRWFDSLFEALQSLESFPTRCAVAPESEAVGEEIRQLLFGNYRVLFLVRKQTVFVLHVRHGSRQTMIAEEIDLP